MTTSTTMTSGTISSTFLTSIQTQKVNLENAMLVLKGNGTDPITTNSNGVSGLVTFFQSYMTFLQQNSQFTSLSTLSSISGISIRSSISTIGSALSSVIGSIYQLEGQEMARISKMNPGYTYQGASQLYQSAYQMATFNSMNMLSWGLTGQLSFASSGITSNQFYGLFEMQSAYAASSEVYTYLKAFVTDYSLTSQIDSLYLLMQHYPDGYGNGDGVTEVNALLNGALQCVNWLGQYAIASASNATAQANVLGGQAYAPNIWLIVGSVAAVGGVATWLLMGRGSSNHSHYVAPSAPAYANYPQTTYAPATYAPAGYVQR